MHFELFHFCGIFCQPHILFAGSGNNVKLTRSFIKRLGRRPIWGSFFPIPLFFQQLMTWELFLHGVLPSCAALRSTPFQSTRFLVLHNLSSHRGGNCFNLSLEKALLPTMRKILNDHFTQYLQYVLRWLLMWKLNKQYPG